MKTLSIKQPWATLIAEGVKDIENRTWKTSFRGRIKIHASAKWDARSSSKNSNDLFTTVQNNSIPWQIHARFIDRGIIIKDSEMPVSAIIGEVDIVDCVKNHKSIWAEKDCYNWVLENAIMYDEPILNVKGKLSLWEFVNSQNL